MTCTARRWSSGCASRPSAGRRGSSRFPARPRARTSARSRPRGRRASCPSPSAPATSSPPSPPPAGRNVPAGPAAGVDPAIRSFEPSDTEPLVALWNRCGLVTATNDPRKDIERKRAVNPELLFVAVQDGAVAGSVMAGYEGHRGWINYLAVDPARRRRGLGRRLMEHAEAALRSRGCAKINLQVRHANPAARAFYERIGYRE